MAELDPVIRYITDRINLGKPLPLAKMIKILYLADWKSAIDRDKQITPIKWRISTCGIEPDRAIKLIENVSSAKGYRGLDSKDKEILEHVIKTYSKRNWGDFMALVYSTYPILNQSGGLGKELNLVSLARLYKRIKTELIYRDKTMYDSDAGLGRDD